MPGTCVIAVIGTDTGVGKTWTMARLVRGLRQAGRRCWVHKPIACGGWDGRTAEDGRALAALASDGQDPATICPLQFPAALSPHLAAAAAGRKVSSEELLANLQRLRGDHDLVIEGIGGLLVPLTALRWTVCDLLAAAAVPVVIVSRPHLGTLNHTALTVAHARRSGLTVLGLVLNHHPPAAGPAGQHAASELPALCATQIIAELRPDEDTPESNRALADGVLARLVESAGR